jgi:hypothetical protein
MPEGSDKTQVASGLREALRRNRNSDGGWAYSAGKRSRLEPTCWALLALAAADGLPVDVERVRFWPRHDGWLVDVDGAPPNQPFNALGALTLLQEPSAAPLAQPIVSNLLAAKGERYPQDKYSTQDNSLQAWSWVEGTASWVEPTAWSLLLLKRLRRDAPLPREAAERIQVGERLLLDRVCSVGGWNYGNAQVFGHDLWPYVPTTALALLALRDHPDLPAVTRSLEQMQSDVRTERSALAVALAVVCLNVYGRDPRSAWKSTANGLLESSQSVAGDLTRLAGRDLETPAENILGQAIALYALSEPSRVPEVFSF